MFGSIGPLELLIIFLIILLVFGANRLPELARTLGRGFREFRKAAEDVKQELQFPDEDFPPSDSDKESKPKDDNEQIPKQDNKSDLMG
ncbi:twin-arginine translocase TatA/TatE family subunit [candidate division KSB1 bacterium]|nr:twin-arginine translocase TatA/TatE family subunit [bacterium]OQX57518.1 MAG: hypothetical protein B5M50_05705 [candidate division KSB1 bacterium 4484_219]RKY80757.1 MAG: twin-arginine translocase TatA/TatE family subunit [candidate division KSB1 bacterium]RKY85654.1 MAG: twin-arginine translocase TatA/TatE family subunit [candidate division KSB1 bacterium]RKY87716.1 MAG: twin-arginine translocase TatA/TatE family subunit [candidate division KSB1 bacterium]